MLLLQPSDCERSRGAAAWWRPREGSQLQPAGLGRTPPQQKKKVKQRVLPSSEEMKASKEAVLKFENMMHRRQHIQEDEKLRMRLTLVEEEEQDQNLVVRTPSRVSAAGERIQQIKEDVEEEEQDLDFAIKTPSSGVPEGDAQSASDSCAELEYQHLLDLATDAEREEVNEKRVKMKLKNKPLPQHRAER